jgi:hypothetical protein
VPAAKELDGTAGTLGVTKALFDGVETTVLL